MKQFMDKDFLLSTDMAKTLYHQYAETMPVLDYHCHINPQEIYGQCAKDISVARDTLLGLHEQGLEFDAVITSDDSLAVGAVKYAHEAGISIPDQLSVIGYNNSLLSRCTDPEITSIDSKVEALCTTTINTLMGVFSGMNVPSRTTIASDLIKRQTTNF